jgi:hypothetical protein
MKITGILFSAAFALSMIVAGSAFAGASGKVDGVEGEGRKVTIAGKTVELSGSRTKVTIGGKPGKRGAIKAGMTCTADVDSGAAKMVACK